MRNICFSGRIFIKRCVTSLQAEFDDAHTKMWLVGFSLIICEIASTRVLVLPVPVGKWTAMFRVLFFENGSHLVVYLVDRTVCTAGERLSDVTYAWWLASAHHLYHSMTNPTLPWQMHQRHRSPLAVDQPWPGRQIEKALPPKIFPTPDARAKMSCDYSWSAGNTVRSSDQCRYSSGIWPVVHRSARTSSLVWLRWWNRTHDCVSIWRRWLAHCGIDCGHSFVLPATATSASPRGARIEWPRSPISRLSAEYYRTISTKTKLIKTNNIISLTILMT